MNNEDLRQPDGRQHVPTVTTNSGPATGEREAELRGLITDVLAVTPKITSTFSFEESGALTNGLVFVLTPLLDRREKQLDVDALHQQLHITEEQVAAFRTLVAKQKKALLAIYDPRTKGWGLNPDNARIVEQTLALTPSAIADELAAKAAALTRALDEQVQLGKDKETLTCALEYAKKDLAARDALIAALRDQVEVRGQIAIQEMNRAVQESAIRDAEIARINEIVSHPATLRRHVQKLFPEYRWEHPEYISRLEEAAQRVDAAESCARVCRQDAEINATRAEKADTALREAEAARVEDSKRLDWLEANLKNMDSTNGGTWLRLGDNGRLQIHRHPKPHHPTELIWHDEFCLLDSIPDEPCGVRAAIDAARAQEAKP